MSTKVTAYSNPNAVGVEKKCPKCFKLNFGDVDVCGGCGADLSNVKAQGAGIRNAGLFSFMPADMPKMPELESDAPKKVIADRVVKAVDSSNLPLSFPRRIAPVRPWA